MVIQATEIKKGMLLDVEDHPWVVVDVQQQTPSARGASLIVKIRLKSLQTGQVLDRSLRGTDRVKEADFEAREAQLTFKDSSGWHFMDLETYEEILLPEEMVGEDGFYLVDGMEGLKVRFYQGRAIGLELPHVVELEIVETDPALKGATAAAQTKPARLETGLVIQVRPYLSSGQRVRVDTRTGKYVERVK